MNRILVLSPHPDDAEFGCGASLWALKQRGAEILHVLVTASEHTVGGEDLLKEFKASNWLLGIPCTMLPGGLLPHRQVGEHRQQLLDRLTIIKRDFKPDTVFMPCLDDTHQDHAAVAQEAFRAFKFCDLLGYDILWNTMAFNSQAFFVVDEFALEQKIAAIGQYKSQVGRPYSDPELIMGAARMRGAQAGATYAEAFANIRRYI